VARKNFSKKREAIYEAICSTKSHPSAEWVYNTLKPEYPDLSLGTVYRNMNGFKDDGMILSVGSVNGQERFDGNTKPHSHFICNRCGDVIDIENVPYNMQADEVVRNVSNCDIDYHLTFFYGICGKCKNIEEDNN